MKNKEYISFMKMIEYIDKSIKYTEGYTFEQFEKDEKTIDATIFTISQIGELVKNISKETMSKYSNIEWNMIKGLRNRIVHDYEGISLKSIWFVINNDIVQLKKDIQNILKDEAIEYITQDIIKYLIKDNNISNEEAMDIWYNSKTYDRLCDLQTHLYYESPAYVYEMLKEELENCI